MSGSLFSTPGLPGRVTRRRSRWCRQSQAASRPGSPGDLGPANRGQANSGGATLEVPPIAALPPARAKPVALGGPGCGASAESSSSRASDQTKPTTPHRARRPPLHEAGIYQPPRPPSWPSIAKRTRFGSKPRKRRANSGPLPAGGSNRRPRPGPGSARAALRRRVGHDHDLPPQG